MAFKRETSVNCIEIELAIMEMFDFRQNLIVPNVSNMMRLVAFETDMLVLTKSGYAHGFEIKVSKSDLKADFSKDHHAQFNVMKNGKTGLERFYSKFKYFSYAVPSELKEYALELIPDFCGLYVYDKPELPKQPKFYCARKPKKLFDYKWSDEKRYELARLGAMRIHSLKKASLWRMTRIKQLKNNLTKESNGKANS
ncbi:MAG: hypothetical protein J0M05_08295 [Candidatus Kapabacteria bacterium]|nr:hypothetical protein [Candidatus Kapabacteria bacterium]